MGPVSKLIGSGIGLASEAVAAHKQSKAQAQGQAPSPASVPPSASSPNPPGYSDVGPPRNTHDQNAQAQAAQGEFEDMPPDYDDIARDEDDWELDDAVEEATGRDADGEGENSQPDVRKITREFLERHPLNSGGHQTKGKIPLPVILPQRRPRTKSRGFVKAYAPVLENCGIDQKTFLDFLKTFGKASQASNTFKVIFVAGHIIGYAPELAAMIVSISIEVAAAAAIILQSRSRFDVLRNVQIPRFYIADWEMKRTNTFLDDVNEHFYKPRGLYALLMTYKPSSRNAWSSGEMDISQTMTKQADLMDDPSRMDKTKHNLQFSAGKTHTEAEMPHAAPLVYPTLDEIAEEEADPSKPAKKPNKFKEKTAFVQDYMDRVGQAKYSAEAPDSSLQVPNQPKFANRYADPNHPARSGSLISLVTGGAVDPVGRRRQRLERKKDARGFYGPVGALRHYQPLKRVMREGVLYLMIVNMPSDEEMATARAELEKRKEEKKAH